MFELPDALLLARIQFAFTISFHFLFPAITIGLASDLAVLEGVWLKTGREDYMNLFCDWIKIFALVFAMGVMLFGMKRVGKGLHFTATLMVALGPFASAFWILSVNSGMQTPAGYAINANGQFISAGNWLAIIFNPSFPDRLLVSLFCWPWRWCCVGF